MSISLISTVTVGAGGAATIDFNSIPGTYTDLMIIHSFRSTNTAKHDDIGMTFNGSTTNYVGGRYLIGTGSAASSNSFGGTTQVWAGDAVGSTETANTFANGLVYIPNYTGTNNKSVSVDAVMETNVALSYSFISAGIWSSSATITSISLKSFGATGNFVQYSTASLYGVTKGSSGGVTVA